MTLAMQAAADFLTFDGLESVTLAVPSDESGGLATIDHALRRAISRREVEVSGGKYTMQDTAWHFPASEGTPRLGGVITESDGTAWTVLETQEQTFGTRWRCVCRKLEIGGTGVTRLVSIEQATWTKGAAGAVTASWAAVATNVAARIQEQLSDVVSDDGQKTTRKTYRISLDVAQTLSESYRLVDSAGNAYKIEAVEPETIGTKQVVRAVRDPFPEAG